MSALSSQQICFIGAGSMAEAIMRGLLETGKTRPDRILVTNRRNESRLRELEKRYGIRPVIGPEERKNQLQIADCLVLAMKPKDAVHALKTLGQELNSRRSKPIVISVIAGLSLDSIARHLPDGTPVARTMPNTSSTIRFGATGVCFSSRVPSGQREMVMEMFRSIGTAVSVREDQIDLVTGVSGSGPAYIYRMMEAMTEAAVEGGLDAETARELVVQTVLGAAQMVKMTGEEPSVLREKVTSPGGTTEAALNLMAECQFAGIVKKAVFRAAERAGELGKMIDSETRQSSC